MAPLVVGRGVTAVVAKVFRRCWALRPRLLGELDPLTAMFYRGKGFYSLIVVYKEKSLTMGI